MFCANCGSNVLEDVNFCPNCGKDPRKYQINKEENSHGKKSSPILSIIAFSIGGILYLVALSLNKYNSAVQETLQFLMFVNASIYIVGGMILFKININKNLLNMDKNISEINENIKLIVNKLNRNEINSE